jgi:hypothetical protein
MTITTAVFETRAKAEQAIDQLVSDHYEPRRFDLSIPDETDGTPGRFERLEVRPRSGALAAWGALLGALFVVVGGAATFLLGGAETMEAVTLPVAAGSTAIGAGLGAIVGSYAGLANWSVVATLEPQEQGRVVLRYKGPDRRARRLAARLERAGALQVKAA